MFQAQSFFLIWGGVLFLIVKTALVKYLIILLYKEGLQTVRNKDD